VTVRGEHATYQGSGLYRYDPASVAREGVVWDVIDLCLALPLFAAAIVLSQHNALRGRLLLGGMLFYFVYKYLMYAVMVAFLLERAGGGTNARTWRNGARLIEPGSHLAFIG